jgi:hypothetical protein
MRKEPQMNEAKTTPAPPRTENHEAPMVKLKPLHGRHRVPARLIRVDGQNAYVIPKGHKRMITVPLRN